MLCRRKVSATWSRQTTQLLSVYLWFCSLSHLLLKGLKFDSQRNKRRFRVLDSFLDDDSFCSSGQIEWFWNSHSAILCSLFTHAFLLNNKKMILQNISKGIKEKEASWNLTCTPFARFCWLPNDRFLTLLFLSTIEWAILSLDIIILFPSWLGDVFPSASRLRGGHWLRGSWGLPPFCSIQQLWLKMPAKYLRTYRTKH